MRASQAPKSIQASNSTKTLTPQSEIARVLSHYSHMANLIQYIQIGNNYLSLVSKKVRGIPDLHLRQSQLGEIVAQCAGGSSELMLNSIGCLLMRVDVGGNLSNSVDFHLLQRQIIHAIHLHTHQRLLAAMKQKQLLWVQMKQGQKRTELQSDDSKHLAIQLINRKEQKQVQNNHQLNVKQQQHRQNGINSVPERCYSEERDYNVITRDASSYVLTKDAGSFSQRCVLSVLSESTDIAQKMASFNPFTTQKQSQNNCTYSKPLLSKLDPKGCPVRQQINSAEIDLYLLNTKNHRSELNMVAQHLQTDPAKYNKKKESGQTMIQCSIELKHKLTNYQVIQLKKKRSGKIVKQVAEMVAADVLKELWNLFPAIWRQYSYYKREKNNG